MPDITGQTPTATCQPQQKLHKILSYRHNQPQMPEYLIEWMDTTGTTRISWEPFSQLVGEMKKIVEFRLRERGSQGERCFFGNMAVFEIRGIGGMGGQFGDRYEVELVQRKSRKIYTMVMAGEQLRKYYCEDYARYLEKKIYTRNQ